MRRAKYSQQKTKIPIDIEQVEGLAARGLNMQEISLALGISNRTLYYRMEKDQELVDAIARGQAKGIAKVTNELFKLTQQGNVTAIIFYLKCRAGWRETQVIENTGLDGSPLFPTKIKIVDGGESKRSRD